MSADYRDPWEHIGKITGKKVPEWAKKGCRDPKIVTIPVGRKLYGAGPETKHTMEWGAFEELDSDWYLRGNQLNPHWYIKGSADKVAVFKYSVTIKEPTPAVMSKVVDQPAAPRRVGPQKFQYYNPAGVGKPIRGRFLGYLKVPNSKKNDEGVGPT